MNLIISHLWFDQEAKEAAEFYITLFPNSRILKISSINNVPSPSGKTDIVSFELNGHSLLAINAGPIFNFNPSISFMVNFDPSVDQNANDNLDKVWSKLAEGGEILMPIEEYPFSKKYGWIIDKYGLSWQLILTRPEGEERPFLIPSLLFSDKVCGKAEEATDFYISVFKGAKRGILARYPKGMEPDREGTLMFTDFMISNQWFAAMDSARVHDFPFTEAFSFVIACDTQDEIDYYWGKLSFDPSSEQCGWCKDKYGVSWQVWPKILGEMLEKGSAQQTARLTQKFLSMKKFNISQLIHAYNGPLV